MRLSTTAAVVAAAVVCLSALTAQADEAHSEAAVETAIRDYVLAKYAGDVDGVKSRAHHGIARAVLEHSYWGRPSADWVRRFSQDHLGFYGTTYNDVKRDDPKSGRLEIEVFDLEQRTAAARVIMEDVVDYMHLVRWNGRWQIADSAVIVLDEAGTTPPAIDMADRDAIEQVVRDYAMGFYEVDGKKVQDTCHPSLSKRAVADRREGVDFDVFDFIDHAQIELLGNTFNTYWKFEPDDARVDVEVYEIRGDVAAAKLTGTIWFDYFHLMKVGGEWKIVNIMYETLPRERWVNLPAAPSQG